MVHTEPKHTHYPKFSSSVFSFTNKNVEIIFRILQGLVQLEVCIFNEIVINFEAFLISEFHCISHGSSLKRRQQRLKQFPFWHILL